MNLQEAVLRCQSEHFDYPEIIDVKSGLCDFPELNVKGIPSWDRRNNGEKRKAILEITTYRGISSNAIHFYGKIVADGVYQATLDNIQKPRNLTHEQEVKYPLFNYHYDFKIKRPITKAEIEKDINRWSIYYDEGDLIEGYENISELINDAKEIFSLRFTGDWDFLVQYPRGNKEKLELKNDPAN